MVLVFVKIVLWERLRCEVLGRLRSGEYYTFRVCFWPKYMHVWVGAFETPIQITRKRNNHFVHFRAVSTTPILRLLPPPHQFIHHKHPRVSSAYARVIVYIPPHQQYSHINSQIPGHLSVPFYSIRIGNSRLYQGNCNTKYKFLDISRYTKNPLFKSSFSLSKLIYFNRLS